MTNKNCCEKCIEWDDAGHQQRCINKNCECHQNKPQEVAEKTFKESIEAGEIECACVGNGKCGKHYFEKEEVVDWEKEFDKKFSYFLEDNFHLVFSLNGNDGNYNLPKIKIDELKSFITKTIAQEYEKGFEDGRGVEKRLKEKWKEELIKELNETHFYYVMWKGSEIECWNKQDVINKIKNNE